MKIRRAALSDLDGVGALTVAAYAEFMEGEEHATYRAQLGDAGPRFREADLLVAEEEDGHLLGTVTSCPQGSSWREIGREDEGEFRMLAVAPSARGLGVGSALARFVVEDFAAHGIARTAISTLPTMTAAHRLYEQLGFVRVPSRDWSPAPGVALVVYELSGPGS